MKFEGIEPTEVVTSTCGYCGHVQWIRAEEVELACRNCRDRFAMAALTGYFANERGFGHPWDEIADSCYYIADKMMAQRLKPPAVSE